MRIGIIEYILVGCLCFAVGWFEGPNQKFPISSAPHSVTAPVVITCTPDGVDCIGPKS